jgi:glycosyltransferase involved in cell wall biosynthesis
LETLRARYAGQDWVRFEGFVAPDRVGEYMAASDLLLIPSLWIENAPLVASEAISLALPMLTSDRGGLPELVVDGETGRALPAGDAPAWQTALLAVLREPALLARWRQNAGQRRRDFDADTLGGRYLQLVEQTIAAPRA